MTDKFTISFNVDLADVSPEYAGKFTDEIVAKVIKEALINPARANARDQIKATPQMDMDSDIKSIRMAAHLRHIMLTIMAEANMSIEPLDADHPVSKLLPCES